MDEYYHILGLPPNSTQAQIKKAYRKLALQFHPDINKSDEANEKFVKITEAYEILNGSHKLKNPLFRYYHRKTNFNDDYRRQTARERARRHAQMQYEEFCRNNEAFHKSWYYRPAQWLVLGIYLLGWCFGVFLISSPVLVSYYVYYIGGFWWQGVLCLPLILAGTLVIHHTILLKKEASPYFKDQSLP